jgi:hypothetical protein
MIASPINATPGLNIRAKWTLFASKEVNQENPVGVSSRVWEGELK